MNYSIQNLHSFCFSIWEPVKSAIRVMEPYQPVIAAGLILGKVGWQIYKQRSLQREIAKFDQKIKRLDKMLDSRLLSKGRFLQVKKVREEYEIEREEKKRQKSYVALAFGQIPSLLFDHPGSNIYHSMHQLASRGLQIHYEVKPVRPSHPTIGSRIKKIASLAGTIISVSGTMASIGRMTNAIPRDNPLSHLLSGLAIGVHAIEGTLISIRTLKTCCERVLARQNHAQQVH